MHSKKKKYCIQLWKDIKNHQGPGFLPSTSVDNTDEPWPCTYTPMNDQDRISPYNTNTISGKTNDENKRKYKLRDH